MKRGNKMSNRKIRFGLLGLCVPAAMAIMAFGGASAAQASNCVTGEPTKSCGMLNGKNVTVDTTVTGTTQKDTLVLLLSKALGTTVAIDCTEQGLVGGTALLLPEGKATGKVEFKSCTTELGGKVSIGCKPLEPIIAAGTLQIVLHEGEAVVKATNGLSPFTEIGFSEKTCTLTNPTPVKGTGWILDCIPDPETELTEHLIIEGKLAAEMLGGLKFGTEPASIDGSLIIKEVKVGTSAALTFSVLAD
jgi:hypothetical protein